MQSSLLNWPSGLDRTPEGDAARHRRAKRAKERLLED